MWCSGYKPRYHSAAFRSSRRRLVVLWSLFGFFIISLESSGSSCCPPKNFLTWVMFRLYSTPSASRVKLFPCWPSQLTVLIKILKSFCHGFVIVSQDLYLQVQNIEFGTSLFHVAVSLNLYRELQYLQCESQTLAVFWFESTVRTSASLDWFEKLNEVLIGASSDTVAMPPSRSFSYSANVFFSFS